MLQTSSIDTDSGLTIFSHENDNKSICIPIDDWLRTQLTTIEKFIISNVTIPSDVRRPNGGVYLYKPLWLHDKMLISLSKWCRFFKFDSEKGAYLRQDQFVPFLKGSYNVNIEVSHVYIGPHKAGQTFSVSLRVTQVVYREESDALQSIDTDFLDDLSPKDSEATVFTCETKTKEKKERKKRAKKGEKTSSPPRSSRAAITITAR